MKYFFLAQGWTYNRVWERNGLWNEVMWRRKPQIRQLPIAIVENEQKLWLYEVEAIVMMVEVKPMTEDSNSSNIGQVVLKRLIDSNQVLQTLINAQNIIKSSQNDEHP